MGLKNKLKKKRTAQERREIKYREGRRPSKSFSNRSKKWCKTETPLQTSVLFVLHKGKRRQGCQNTQQVSTARLG